MVVKKMIGNVKDDKELEMLIGEISKETSSQNLKRHGNNGGVCGGGGGGGDHISFGNFRNVKVYYDEESLNQITSPNTVSEFSIQSDGSSSSLFSNCGHSLTDTRSPTPPPLEESNAAAAAVSASAVAMSSGIGTSFNPINDNNRFWMPELMWNQPERRFYDDLTLSADLSEMYIGNGNGNDHHQQQQQGGGNVHVHDNALGFSNFSAFSESNQIPINAHNNNNNNNHLGDYYKYNSYKRSLLDSDPVGFIGSPISQCAEMNQALPRNYEVPNFYGSPSCTRSQCAEMNPALPRDYEMPNFYGSPSCTRSQCAEMNPALPGDYEMANFYGSPSCSRRQEPRFTPLYDYGVSMDAPRHGREMMNNYCCRGSGNVAPLRRNPIADASLYEQKYGMNLMEERGMSRFPNYLPRPNYMPSNNMQDFMQCGLPLPNAMPPSNARMPPVNLDAITREGSFILQGEAGLNYVYRGKSPNPNRLRCQSAMRETTFAKHQQQRSELNIRNPVVRNNENPKSPRSGSPLTLPQKFSSLLEVRGRMYSMAKDQHGCRLLQRKFDEGVREDVRLIFNEIIPHVVELMMNPFGNYLMQKLLVVCSEQQMMQIILMVTEKPGQLVKISLNSHGTRVVQKLIETLRTREQISLVVSALEPGFLSLIKDLNGNHVVQHCLEYLSEEDNMFIFDAAAMYCVEIATHQHGCCVLQRCIEHSRGKRRERLVAEISAHALLLAQDQFGNYVVQFILDLGIPSARETITSQFEDNYVLMSMQKFSSHVVEKCLTVFNDGARNSIINELVSAPQFEQLLQDPHANYVIQSALRLSEGRAHNKLVEAVESHKAISRNSPYSKKIFSQKLLKK